MKKRGEVASKAASVLGRDMDEEKKAAAAAAEVKTDWKEVWDPSNQAYYYYNEKTEECVWDKPAELEAAEQAALTGGGGGGYYDAVEGKFIEGKEGGDSYMEWIQMFDPLTKKPYY